MPNLYYRKNNVTNTIETYSASESFWEEEGLIRFGGSTYYFPMTSDLSHDYATHLRFRQNGFTYTAMHGSHGQLWGWGSNSRGQIGDLTTAHKSSPVQVGSATRWHQVASGESHITQESNSAGIDADKKLWTWGRNTEGALGVDGTANRSSPTLVGVDHNWKQVDCGRNRTMAVKRDATLWGAGSNSAGQIGDGTITNVTGSFKQIGALTNWKRVAAGLLHTVALKTDGTIWSWGYNNVGQLGHGDITHRSSPVQIGSLTDWVFVTTSDNQTFGIRSNGSLWGWGENTRGQLGQSDIVDYSSPVQIGAGQNWKKCAAGSNMTFMINSDADLWGVGQGVNGGLGRPDNTDRSSPVLISGSKDWRMVAAGGAAGAAVKSNGTLYTWGNSAYGAMGNGTSTGNNISSPTQLGSNTDWKYIAMGEHLTVLGIRG